MPKTHPVQFHSAPGAVLNGTLFLPDAPPRRAILLNGATGVPHGYYARFAAWLAEQEQAVVLTYDYRDFGASSGGSLRASRATMADWGAGDQSAAADFLLETYPDLPLWVIGHSLGGLFVPFYAQAEKVARVIAVASGPAHWTRHPLTFMPTVLFFWLLAGPLATLLLGYTPGRLIGSGENLPAGVFWQWRRWCLSRRFYRSDWGTALPVPRFEAVRCPVTLVSIADDAMLPPKTVARLRQFYPDAQVEHRTITPASIGARSIGHIRVFADRHAAAWPALLA